MKIVITCIALLCGYWTSIGQQPLYPDMFQASSEQWLLSTFYNLHPGILDVENCPPPFRDLIPEQSTLEIQLAPLLEDKATENRAIQTLLADNCKRLMECKALFDLYSPLFRRHLHESSLEADLAYLPLVLSGFNPEWQGRNNRAGLWQLDYLIARNYDLKVDGTIDERKAADLATRTAMSYLRDLDLRYEGDQVKVLAAYLKDERFADALDHAEIFEDQELRDALTLLLVSTRLMKNFETPPLLLKWLEWLNTYEAVALQQTLYKAVLVDLINWDMQDLNGLNPAFLADSIPAKYRRIPFLIPADKLTTFQEAADAIYAKPEPVALVYEVLPATGESTTYLVRPGDVLGKIAEHHGVSVRQIKEWNSLHSDQIQIGQELVLYPKRKVPVNSPAPSSGEAQTKPQSKPITYTVRPGESLWYISRKYPGVSPENIMEWNGIDATIQPGQKLKIYPKL